MINGLMAICGDLLYGLRPRMQHARIDANRPFLERGRVSVWIQGQEKRWMRRERAGVTARRGCFHIEIWMKKVTGKQATTCNDWFQTLPLLVKMRESVHRAGVYKTERSGVSTRSSTVFVKQQPAFCIERTRSVQRKEDVEILFALCSRFNVSSQPSLWW